MLGTILTVGGLVAKAIGGDWGDKITSIVDDVDSATGGGMTAEQKFMLKQKLSEDAMERQRLAVQAANDAERNLTERIGELEGTASDLKSIPVLGPLMLFVRGMIRPMATIMVLVIDWQVFSGGWHPVISYEAVQGEPLVHIDMLNLLFLLNGLVLSFWFGERAIKNVMPFVTQMMKARAGQ